MWSLSLLGPPRLRNGADEVPLTVKKACAVLLVLACSGRTLRPRLAAQLWPGLDEPAARRNLRRELARLRESGAAALVQAQGDWLALDDAVRTDLAAFEAALGAGDAAAALAHWHGPLAESLQLEDAPEFDRWLDTQRERWRGLWRRAVQAVAETAPPEQALLQWQALLDDDPLQEQTHRALMRLHAAAGRREAALAQYDRCKALLRDELGLAPVAETEALAAALKSPARPAPPAAEPPPRAAGALPETLPFVGRSAEVAAMEAAWREWRPIVIEGEGGIGKTRLALDFAAAHGAYALVRCRSGDRDVPYAAWTRALRVLTGPQPTRGTLAALPGWVVDEVSRLLPELAVAGVELPPIRSDDERSRFVEAQAAAWHGLAADSFDAVVFDDWHHADAASRALLAYVVQRRLDRDPAAAAGLREIVVSRPELDAESAFAWRTLCDGTRALHLVLPALPADVLLDLVQRLSGAGDPSRFAARLMAATAGNPFFVAETLRHWLGTGLIEVGADGVWRTRFDGDTQDYRELPVPGSVREAVLARVRRLGDASQRVLEAAALAPEPFAPALLAPACALSELDTVLAIEQAVQAQLLREHEAGGYGYTHDLVQQALESALSAERRRLVHRRLALGAEAAGASAALIAMHHEASGDPRRAVAHRLRAGDEAQRLHALREAAAHWRQGLADQPTPAEAVVLRLRLLRVMRPLALADEARGHCEQLRVLSRDATLGPAQAVEAVVAAALHLAQSGSAAEALTLLDQLRERTPGGLTVPQQVQLIAARLTAHHFLGRLDEARAVSEAALALPGLTTPDRAELLFLTASNEHLAGRYAATVGLLEQAIPLWRQLGDAYGLIRPTMLLGAVLAQMDRWEEAGVQFEQVVELATGASDLRMQRVALYNIACVRLTQMRAEASLDAARRGWELVEAAPNAEVGAMLRCRFVAAHLLLGQLGAASVHAAAAVPEVLQAGQPYTMAAVAMYTLELFALFGDRATPEPLLQALGTADSLRPMAQVSQEFWVARLQAAVLLGDTVAAAAAVRQLAPDAEIEDPFVLQRARLARAEWLLLQGGTGAALDALPPLDARGMTDELRMRVLAVRVAAESRGGALAASTEAAARAALAAPVQHLVAALHLRAALAAVRPADGPGHLELVQRLVASLDGHPREQAAFRRRWDPTVAAAPSAG